MSEKQPLEDKFNVATQGTGPFLKAMIWALCITILVWVAVHTSEVVYSFNGIVAVFSAVLIAISISFAIRSHKERLIFDERLFKEHMEYQFNRADFDKHILLERTVTYWYKDLYEQVGSTRELFVKYRDDLESPAKCRLLVDKFKTEIKEHMVVTTILNFLEHVALMVENQLLDEGRVKERFRGIYVNYYDTLRFYIDARRESDKDDRKENYRAMETLARKWSNKTD